MKRILFSFGVSLLILAALILPSLSRAQVAVPQVPGGNTLATIVRSGGFAQVDNLGNVIIAPAPGGLTKTFQPIDFAEMATPSLSASGHSILYMNDSDHTLHVSENGGADGALPGTTSSVALALPNIFSVSGSPVTTTGTLTATLATEAANTIFAGPASGAATAPTFRAAVDADLPVDVPQNIQFTLTSADILALETTPITIVATPGSGKITIVDGIMAKLVYNSTTYTGSNPIQFAYTNASGQVVAGSLASSFIDSASGTNYYYGPPTYLSTGFAPVANAPIVAFVGSANPAVGNSTIVLTILYHTITP